MPTLSKCLKSPVALLRLFKREGSRCKMGSADLHGFAARRVNLLRNAAPLQMYTVTPFSAQKSADHFLHR
jgi:hypothetical protein